MRLHGKTLEVSATDLSNFLGCRHRTALDMAVAWKQRPRPPKFTDPLLELLWKRGLEHEKSYVELLKTDGHAITDLSGIDSLHKQDELLAATLDAMRSGAQVIVQGALHDGCWFGKPDVLRRVDLCGDLGAWSYEVTDTKLARETRAGAILQLGLYSEMLGLVQGVRPEHFHVVTPDKDSPKHTFRLDDFAAYLRLIRKQMLAIVALDPDAVALTYYPVPVDHCGTCRWNSGCDEKRHKDDDLSIVAAISRLQRKELQSHDINTLADLGCLALPIPFRPSRGSLETYVRVREQARLQVESRGKAVPVFELRDIVQTKDEGLCRLPEPSPGDLFLDLEGDPLAAEHGREYLFGVVRLNDDGTPTYTSFWGLTERDERAAFEQVMDLITAAWERHPGMHVYHYAPYEPSAFKRLMGRYVTRERELDNLLRNEKFVDLYAVVRQGVVAGTEKYSIKNLEPLYGFKREVQLFEANRCLRVMELALQLNAPETAPPEVLDAVQGYNEDDCVSTLRLRDWLETVRAEHIAKGWDIPRPKPPESKVEELTERDRRVEGLRAKLLQGVPDADREPEQQVRWLLANLLDYHRREDKAVWWEYFRLRELPEEDLYDEPQAITGMEFVERVDVKLNSKTGKPTGTVTDRYRYPPQEMEIDRGELKLKEGGKFGEVAHVDRVARTIDIAKGKKCAEYHPTSVFAHTHVPTTVLEDSIYSIAEQVAMDGHVSTHAGRETKLAKALLLALPPIVKSGQFGLKAGEDAVAYLKAAGVSLDSSILPVQGPPGSGKSHCGAEMVCALVNAGKRVGIAATSHKVIRHLLKKVATAARKANKEIGLAHKADDQDYGDDGLGIVTLKDNNQAAAALSCGEAQVLGGTAWLWSSALFAGSVDVLLVDEAGQMSLANVLAMTPAAKSIVLLGDPQQLEQPRKGTHPDGVGVSALEHMLKGRKTVPADRGVFLPLTWRLCPPICAFTSELFYEGRLDPKPGLERQRLDGAGAFDGNGLWLLKCKHDGNRTSSIEEIDLVAGLVEKLTAKGVTWTKESGEVCQLKGSDILIVAPYNAQVSRLTERLAPTGVSIGTVDKFQGQEAPVVIYSMATSRPEDAPRGMEFLYSANRLNVATSRARCVVILVANEPLFEPECRTPRQMKLANALCRYAELARPLR